MTIATEPTSRRHGAVASELNPRHPPAQRDELQPGTEAAEPLDAAAEYLATVFEGARSRAQSRGRASVLGG